MKNSKIDNLFLQLVPKEFRKEKARVYYFLVRFPFVSSILKNSNFIKILYVLIQEIQNIQGIKLFAFEKIFTSKVY